MDAREAGEQDGVGWEERGQSDVNDGEEVGW
jgi:hypothetical protein